MHSSDHQALTMEPVCEKWFQHFMERRRALICAYERGDLNKREFLQSNLKDLDNSNVRPFLVIDRLEKGIFNYQYFNALAKRYRMEARHAKRRDKSNREYCHCLSLAEKYYGKKDDTILEILEFMNYQNLHAYHVHCRDKNLQDQLFEIVFIEYPEFILHSKSKEIYEKLCKHDVFIKEKKQSKIDGYINDPY
ncbi:MAG: DUF6648 family protein [Peptoniphilus sp.]|nr:DUF6648 family protein [Peptoniphilus sp.]MDD7363739.1 hypothetical protein [Bacillota bacterium]MDY6044124.1 DUF6648 family protein [Peptoniphilus sp.]